MLWDGNMFYGEDLFENQGDWFVETPSLVHSAQVTSAGPLVVLQPGLLKTGEPPAVPVA